MDRKDFLQKAFQWTVGKGLELVTESSLVDSLEQLAEDQTLDDQRRERPPGAHPDERAFKTLCTGCDCCMAACPINVLMIEDMENRLPVLFPDEGACIHCEGYPCIESCPTGALSLEYPLDTRIL